MTMFLLLITCFVDLKNKSDLQYGSHMSLKASKEDGGKSSA